MRIAMTVDPYLPVPPRLYGGIERIVDLLVRGLAARGHEITLFAHPESRTTATLRPTGYRRTPRRRPASVSWRRSGRRCGGCGVAWISSTASAGLRRWRRCCR
jgi:hypothetical protein